MADPEQATSIKPIYGLDDKPELGRTLVLSAQSVAHSNGLLDRRGWAELRGSVVHPSYG